MSDEAVRSTKSLGSVGIRTALVLFGTLAVADGLLRRRRLRQAGGGVRGTCGESPPGE